MLKVFTKLLLALGIIIALSACTKSKDKPRDSLTFTTPAVKTLDSVKSTDGPSFGIISNTQEMLMVYDHDTPRLGAAKRYEVSKDGKTYTFHLRHGMKWSDGKPLLAKDFYYAWMRVIDKDVGANYANFLFVVKNARDYYLGRNGVKKEDVGIKALDDYTFVVTLTHPVPYFTQIAAFPVLAPQRQDFVERYDDTYGSRIDKIIYSGPYVVSSWQKGAKIILTKNPHYYNADKISVKTIRFLEVKEFSTQYQMFDEGQLDAILGRSGEFISRLESGARDNRWHVEHAAAPSVFYIGFNLKGAKALASKKVRLALSLTTRRKVLVDKILKNNTPAYGFVTPGILVGDINYRDKVKEPLKGMSIKDPKALFIEGLKELGLDPDPATHTFRLLLESTKSDARIQGEFFKDTWEKQLGVKVVMEPAADTADYIRKEHNGEYDLAYTSWGADFNSPLTFLELFASYSGNNSGKYYNKEVDTLLGKAQQSKSLLKRIALYKDIEEILTVSDPAMIPVSYKQKNLFYKKYVEGLQLVNFGGRYQLRWLKIGD